jgi:lipoate-protein ligase A
MLCRRISGGGTVLHGPGNINYTLFFSVNHSPALFNVRRSYEIILGMVMGALERLGYECSMQGLSDIAISAPGRGLQKISGNAQFRKLGLVAHHGTILAGSDLVKKISRYLKQPPRQPEYRMNRSHEDFVASLPDTFDPTAFFNCLSREVATFSGSDHLDAIPSSMMADVLSRARQLAARQYSRADWIMHARHALDTEVA